MIVRGLAVGTNNMSRKKTETGCIRRAAFSIGEEKKECAIERWRETEREVTKREGYKERDGEMERKRERGKKRRKERGKKEREEKER